MIIGSYLRKEKAEEAMAKAIAKEHELIECSKKCGNCPFLDDPFESVASIWPKHKNYCKEAKLSDWDEASFEIIEVEVVE